MIGAKAIERSKQNERGSATIEAAIVMPVFLVVLFSIAYIIRIFHTYNTVQTSLSEVARRIGNMSYFYYVSGLKEYSDQLSEMADKAGGTLEDQKNTLFDAFQSFNDTVSGLDNNINPETGSVDHIQSIIQNAENFDNNMADTKELIEAVVSDPKAELRLFMTIFAQKLSYEATNRLVCLIAKGDLASELNKRVGAAGGDAALSLGIKGGVSGLNFQQSSVFGDSESLEFIVSYSLKAPVPFGIIPELMLSNRVRIIAWTGGRGRAVREKDEESENSQTTTGTSVWMEMDKDKRYWDRGLEVEGLYADKLVNESQNSGVQAFAASNDYPVIDAYTFEQSTGTVVYYDVFTLNPFMKTYSSRPSTITSEIKKHGLRLMEFEETPDNLAAADIENINRVVVLIVPENTGPDVDKYVDRAKADLALKGVEVRVVKGYGSYTPEEKQDQQLDNES